MIENRYGGHGSVAEPDRQVKWRDSGGRIPKTVMQKKGDE
jgi:hypothetical protein